VTLSFSRSGAHHLLHRLGVVAQPVVQLGQGQVDQPVVQVVAQRLIEEPTQERRDRLLPEARHQCVVDQRGDVLVAHLAQGQHGQLSDLVDHATRVVLVGQPGGHPGRDRGGRHPVADDLLVEEVLSHEVLEPLAEIVLALRDQRRVRDRQPERVLEQRGHREPVRDRTHHRRLGAGVDEAEEAVLVERHDVDGGGEEEQRHRDGAHLA
jgi:hypothetical protein